MMIMSTTRPRSLIAVSATGALWRTAHCLGLLLLAGGCASDTDPEIGSLGQALQCSPVTIEAESMNHSTGGPISGGWNIWSNGSISATRDLSAGPTIITVRARGEAARGVFPHMAVRVGGVTVGDVTVSSASYADYSFTYDAPGGNQLLSVAFDNDLYSPPEDRNLIVDSVTVSCTGGSDDGGDSNLTGQLALWSDWGSGFCMGLQVTNSGGQATSEWQAVLDLHGTQLQSTWGADFGSSGGQATVTPHSYNAVIQPGQTNQSVGFCGTRPSGGNGLPSLTSVSNGSMPDDPQGLIWPIDCIPGESCYVGFGCPDILSNSICGSASYAGHQGTDIGITQQAQDAGTAVWAAADGEVLWVFDGKYDRCPDVNEPDCQDPGYTVCTPQGPYCGTGTGTDCSWCFAGGNVVVIRHHGTPGVFATRYDHLKRNSILVQPGDQVTAGQKIAEAASAGNSSGPHLHFEVWGTGFYELADPWGSMDGSVPSLWAADPPWTGVSGE